MTQNILPASVASDFPPYSLEPQIVSKLTRDELIGLFANERTLRALKAAAAGDSNLLHTITRLCGFLTDRKTAVCLLDFDVLRTYLELDRYHVRQSTPDALSIEVFIDYGKMNFAFPLGAFEELLEYLQHKSRTCTPSERVPSSRRPDMNPAEALAEVLHVLGPGPNVQPSESCLLNELEARSDGVDAEIVRLIAMLRNPRWLGVRSQFEKDDVDKWAMLQALHPSLAEGSAAHKTKNIRRDAVNLAIALYDLIHVNLSGKEPLPESYMLVTQTERLNGMVLQMASNERMRAYSATSFGIDLSQYSDRFCVVSPRDLAILEWFGDTSSVEKLRHTNARAELYMASYTEFEVNLDEEIKAIHNQSRERQQETVHMFEFARQQRLMGVFRGVITTRSHLQRLQRRRSLADASQSAQIRWQQPEAEAQASVGELISREKLWSQVEVMLAEGAGVSYQVEIQWPSAGQSATRFVIKAHPPISNQVVYGELTYQNNDLLPSACTLSWPTLCLEDDFAEVLNSLLRFPVSALSTAKPQAERDTSEDIVLAFADGTTFQIRIKELPPGWSWINAKWLRTFLRNNARTERTQLPDLDSLVIQLSYCTIVYQYRPESISFERVISLSSQFNVSGLAASLLLATSPTYYLSEPLLSAFDNIFGCFRPVQIL